MLGVMHTRRPSRVRHEFRFGGREIVVLGAVLCLIASLVFAAGVVVGREMARVKGTPRAEWGREHRSPEPDGLRGRESPVKTAAARAEEKVTFYRTLTAPTQDLPQVGKPTIEERLIPKDDPTPPAVTNGTPEASQPGLDSPALVRRPPKAAEAASALRPARPAKATTPPARSGPTQFAAAGSVEADAWTVQVSAFRSRALAEELRARLAARGFDAYVFPSLAEDGRPRYRVRVGTYPARSDAERVAADLRGERGLSPLVTPRTR
jgi:cell division protein FtsN